MICISERKNVCISSCGLIRGFLLLVFLLFVVSPSVVNAHALVFRGDQLAIQEGSGENTAFCPTVTYTVVPSAVNPDGTGVLRAQSDEGICTSVDELASALHENIIIREPTVFLTYQQCVSGSTSEEEAETIASQVAREAVQRANPHTGAPDEGDYLGILAQRIAIFSSPNVYNGVLTVHLTYHVGYSWTAEQEEILANRCKEVLCELEITDSSGEVRGDLSEYDKVRKIYDYVTDNVTYDNDHLNDSAYLLQYSPYAALVDGTAVCQGYAGLMYRLLLMSGVDARCVTSNVHMWNIVRIDDVYYNVDATWGSSATNAYDWLLISDDKMNALDGDGRHARQARWLADEFGASYPMASTDYEMPDREQVNINSAEVSISRVGTQYYTGKPIKPAVELTYDGGALVEGRDYTVSYKDNIDVTINNTWAFVVIQGIHRFKGRRDMGFIIEPADISGAIVSVSDQTYRGTELKPKVTVTLNGRVIDKSSGYSVDYGNNVDAGTAMVFVYGEGSYTGQADGVFKINKASNTITLQNATRTITGSVGSTRSFSLGARSMFGKPTYISDTKQIAVSSAGKATVARNFTGKAKIRVSASGTDNYKKAASKTVTVNVKPGKMALGSITGHGARKVKVSWKKMAGADAYQVRSAVNKKMTKAGKVYKVKGSASHRVIGKLAGGKTYYVQVRAYDKQTRSWGAWSVAKKAKVTS